jgi:hypothetical protein
MTDPVLHGSQHPAADATIGLYTVVGMTLCAYTGR